jgi:hypothetical protein
MKDSEGGRIVFSFFGPLKTLKKWKLNLKHHSCKIYGLFAPITLLDIRYFRRAESCPQGNMASLPLFFYNKNREMCSACFEKVIFCIKSL